MPPLVVLFDACVLYPAPLRDFILQLAYIGLFRARWTAQIHDEWTRNLLANRPDLKPERLQRTRDLMDRAIPDCLVTGYEKRVESLTLPDPDDRHVLAAAIEAGANGLVTFNVRDFPPRYLASLGVRVWHPDEFFSHLLWLDSGTVCLALKQQRLSLKNPPCSAQELLATLEQQGLPKSVSMLRNFVEHL